MTRPWLVAGDFNVITDDNDIYGGNPVSLNEVEDFRHCITTCNLTDLGYKGSIFTWWNGRGAEHLQDNWETYVNANSFYVFNSKLKNLKKVLTAWSRSTYGDIFQQITNMEEVIKAHETIFDVDPSYANREKLNKVNAERTRLLSVEEEFWKQKAGMAWFQKDDKNSKFFHAHVNGKRKKLQLRRIQNGNGNWLETDAEIADEATRFF
ncbi:uncharacterized protein LOC132047414 [Lycium ferocissimum]|uniref:uncharacterized protein LOC132047414 n=1 Tax=Lycium ferocissimum TaxID=112874 RepID=UPI0028166DCB|nr:uncharacterized protein LOC132047414 [Lycium ferocissimum]